MITLNIDVKKIEKARLYEGQKGTYLDCVLIETPNGHSDYMIVQSVSKEERDAGVQGAILGNAKDWSKSQPQTQAAPPADQNLDPDSDEGKDDLPF
ncbi:MAG: hypothetical protein ACYTEQ_30795 [Planctomycetota bacterium]|jgi:hypothetical protein